jgi:hypothetical protein
MATSQAVTACGRRPWACWTNLPLAGSEVMSYLGQLLASLSVLQRHMSARARPVSQRACRWSAGPEPGWHIAAVLSRGRQGAHSAPQSGAPTTGSGVEQARGAPPGVQLSVHGSAVRKPQKKSTKMLEGYQARAQAVTATRRARSAGGTAARPRTHPRRTRPAAPRARISSRRARPGTCQHSQRSNRTACPLHQASRHRRSTPCCNATRY